jgi:uncharacterized alpha-E superfamily protein
VLDHRFPRSIAYCHSLLRDNLASLARIHGVEGTSHTLMRQSDTRLADLTIDEVFEQGLHEFLTGFINCNSAIAAAIGEDYRFLA